MKPILLIIGSFLFLSDSYSQKLSEALQKLGSNPLIFLDSQEVEFNDIRDYDPFDIAHVEIIVGKKALKLLGERGKDGLVNITTVKKAKMSYWKYFSSKSSDYKNLVPDPLGDTTVQYILNGELLPNRHDGALYQIANKNFRKLKMIGKDELINKYQVTGRDIGVVIKAKKVKNVKAD